METRTNVRQLFYIKRTKLRKNGEAPVYLKLTVNTQSVEVAIGETIPPELWSVERGGAKGATHEAKKVNVHLERTSFQINQIISEMKSDHSEITAKSVINAYLGKSNDHFTLIQSFEEHNQNARLLIGKDLSQSTVQEFEGCLRTVKQYLKSRFDREDIPVEKIDYDFICGFEMFLKSVRNCEHNTCMKLIKMLKKIIRINIANGWIRKDPFSGYKISYRKVDRGFLTESELDTLINLELTDEYHQYARDCFVFGCFTGLAYSDLKSLSSDNLFLSEDGKLWIQTKRKKTDSSCHIPVLPMAQKILDKYENNPHCIKKNRLLPVPCNQKLNFYLKEVTEKTNIKKRITTHLARHTFATTVTLNNDIPIESVSKMLGHSSINMTKIYARLLDKKIGQDMEKLFEKYKA
ncbi:MAG: site-specific integrase [Bacteroidota bacterium]